MKSRLSKLPIFGRLINEIETNVHNLGIQNGFARTFKDHNVEIVADYDEQTAHILEHEACILVVNHPHEIEVIALAAALPPRKDAYVIANAGFMAICPSVDKHILPVYVTNNEQSASNWPFIMRLAGKLHPLASYDANEEHKKNIETINAGGQKLIEGATVAIFPDRHSTNGHWFNGVGYMTKAAENTTRDLFVVNVFVEGTTSHDYLRLLRPIAKRLPDIEVHVSQPTKINDLLDLEPKEITRILETSYREWVASNNKAYSIPKIND
ncbi:hypothetical protein KC614_01135 [candidate division WWE3 bacterium]|uniref:Uncharacterized protein n=1 Tax=candidate division WWE3 bacterium TaxID=2053526 RepID=A0A955LJV7_UNCKA|nr:hypothetical protein [candidate division WWE3 bacterium]